MESIKNEYPIFIKFETTTFLIYVDNYTTVDQLIDLIKIKVFEKLNLDIFKVENKKFNFISNKSMRFNSEELKTQIFDLSLKNFFIPNITYTINILSFELPEDPDCFNSLKKIMNFLGILKESGSQVIISPYSANVTNDYYKNILQQFHYDIIERETPKIVYLLIDGAFFNDRNKEVYHLLNCRELKLPEMINVKNLKLFKLNEPYIHFKTPDEYEELFNELVLKKIENKTVLFLILKCKIDTEILGFLKEYRRQFQFRAFGGGEYDFWFNK
jgi:hypothetical protein